MKNGLRWEWVVIVVAGLFLAFYYFVFPFRPPYYFWGWRYRSFGPGMWPAYPFFGLLALIVFGSILVRLLFPTSRREPSPPNEGWTFCPHCGGDLRQAGKTEKTKGEQNVSLPRT